MRHWQLLQNRHRPSYYSHITDNPIKLFFSRITVIDLIIVFLVTVAAGYAAFHFSRKSTHVYVDLTYEGQDWSQQSIPPSYVKTSAIEIGDTVYNSTGNEVAKVVAVQKVYWGSNRQRIRLTLLMNVLNNTATHSYTLNGQTLLIGETTTFNIGLTSFTGLITNIYTNPNDKYRHLKTADAAVTVKYRNLDPWHAEALKTMSAVTDSAGQVLAEVDAVTINPAELLVTTAQGEVKRQFSPIGKDVIIELKLHDVTCTSDSCFFLGDQPLKIGYPLYVSNMTVGVGSEEVANASQLSKSSIMSVQIVPRTNP